MNKLFNYFYFIKMLSLKELLFDNVWKNSDRIDYTWYSTYRDNLMKFLEKAYIDKIYGSSCFRIIIDYEDEQDESLLVNFVGRFVPKNNGSNNNDIDMDELVDIRQLLHDNNVNLSDIDSNCDILLDEELRAAKNIVDE